jgi:CheY-like chemotaxis protein
MFTVLLPIPAVRIREETGDERITGDSAQVEPTESGHAPPRPPVRLDGVQVLVVDDEPDARRVLALVLERVGAVVATADSARAAIDALPSAHPDVLISDLGMPEQDGLDLIRQLRSGGHSATDLPAIALTAFVQKDDAQSALSAGFQVHLPKPVDPQELTSVIARLARRSD